MRRFSIVVAFLGAGMWGCGGGYGNNTGGSPGAPSPTDGVIVNVVAINGAQSFSPNPATIPVGATVVWHNIDTQTHRVVLNDRSIDTGNLGPGAFSSPMTLGSPGPYHCSIHPEMVGTLVR